MHVGRGGPGDGTDLLITKGAVGEVFAQCCDYALGETGGPMDAGHLARAQQETARLNAEGFRVVAVAYKIITARSRPMPWRMRRG